MSSDSKQLKLGQKKKAPEIKITERTEIDQNTWDLPDDVNLLKEAIDICELHLAEGVNTFYLCQNKMQWDFAFDDGTLLFTNHPCPGCGKKHNASIDLETAETTQHCNTVNAIFMNVNGKKTVQVQMICPEENCEKHHNIVDYPVWKTISDKRCSDCQQKTVAEKEAQRKKSKKLSKEEESTAQPTPAITIEEVEEAVVELLPDITDGSVTKYLGKFQVVAGFEDKEIVRLIHPDYNAHLYLTIKRNAVDAMKQIFHEIYKGNHAISKPFPVHIMNYNAFDSYQVTAEKFTAGYNKDTPLEFTQLKTDNWLLQLFPDFEYPSDYFKTFGVTPSEDDSIPKKVALNKSQEASPRGDDIEKTSLKADNGTRDGIPFAEETKQNKQISLNSYATMRINVNKLKTTEFQFRSELDPEHIDFLKDSMNQKRADGSKLGNIEAVLVREIDDGFYEILSGHHRVAAAEKAKQKSIKCEVVDVDDPTAIKISLIPNLSRKDMSHLEEAKALLAYRDKTDFSYSEIGKDVGRSKQWVASRFALLNTSEEVQKSIAAGEVTTAHVKAVSALDSKTQDKLLKKVAKDGMSSHNLEWEVRQKKKDQEKLEKAEKDVKKFIKYLDKNLADLKEKTVSKTSPWSSAAEELYDMHINDLLEKTRLSEYRNESAKFLKPFYDALKEKGIKLVDGRKLEQQQKTDAEAARLAKKEEEKKSDPCKHCDIKDKLFNDKYYCPVGDPSEKNPDCEHFYESTGYSWAIPATVQGLCFICEQKIERGKDIVTDYKNRSRDNSCYHDLLLAVKGLSLDPCTKCKLRGDCTIQRKVANMVLNEGLSLSMNSCAKFVDESRKEMFHISFDNWNELHICSLFKPEKELASGFDDIARYILKNELSLKDIPFEETEDSKEVIQQLTDLMETIKTGKKEKYQYLINSDEYHYSFLNLETYETEDELDSDQAVNYIVELDIPLEKFKATNEGSKELLKEIQKGYPDT